MIMDGPPADVVHRTSRPVRSTAETTTMPGHKPRLTIGRMMVAVGVAAEIFALLRMTNGTGPVGIMLMLPLISVSSLISVRYAKPGRWLLIATWVAVLWPLTIAAVIPTAFGTATLALGRPPVHGDASPLLSTLESVIIGSCFASMAATLVGFYLPLWARNRSEEQPGRWNPQMIPVLLIGPAWLLTYVIVGWDPVGAFRWLSD